MPAQVSLTQRIEEMHQFLSTQIGPSSKTASKGMINIDNIFLKENIAIHAYWGQQQFFEQVNFTPSKDSTRIDVDKDNLQEMHKRLIEFVVSHNQEGLIPGFVFLQSETQFIQSALEQRVVPIVNQIGFSHQVLESKVHKRAIYDYRTLKPLEVALMTLMQQTKLGEIKVPYKGMYEKELYYYNPNKGFLEVHAYKNRSPVDPILVSPIDTCYYCKKEEDYAKEQWYRTDHKKCKETTIYLAKVLKRQDKRYVRNVYITNQKGESKGNNIQLSSAILDKEYLEKRLERKLDLEEYRIALIK